jgi:molybdopterin-containing oxidoreductase family iron-sulfur binding subunit
MDRRNFFRILSTSAGALTCGCGNKTDVLIPLLVPEHEIVPGEELWYPAVCTECAAGCATLVRIMQGERIIQRNGEKVRERIAAIKKIEGNPLDPVSGGRLCARGQASVQGLYHPDRLRVHEALASAKRSLFPYPGTMRSGSRRRGLQKCKAAIRTGSWF